MSSKKEDLHIQLQDSVRKLEYMINDVIERFDFDQGATTDPEEAMVFAYNRGNMWTQLEISRDYILEIKKLLEKAKEPYTFKRVYKLLEYLYLQETTEEKEE